MGSTNGVTRGQLRPHFSGRSPPFLLAALCVGLGILGVSYWSLSTQYNDLEEQLKKALQRKESIESDQNFIQKQLHLREDEFSRAKVSLQKKEQEVIESNNELKAKIDEMTAINSKLENLKNDNVCIQAFLFISFSFLLNYYFLNFSFNLINYRPNVMKN